MDITKIQIQALNRKRGELNITKKEMAKQVGVSELTMLNILNGNVSDRVRRQTITRLFNWLSENS